MRVVGISGSLRAGSYNRALLAAAAAELPAGVEFHEWTRARDATRIRRRRRRPVRRAGRRPATARARDSRRGRDRDAGVQRLDPRCAQERARLGVEALPGQLPARQAGRRVGASTGLFGAVWAQAELRKVLQAIGARRGRDLAARSHGPNRVHR